MASQLQQDASVLTQQQNQHDAEKERVAAAGCYLLQQPAVLRRMSELQLDAHLRNRRRDGTRAASFSWLFGQEVLLC
jgi:hypothetical protein